MNLWLQQTIKGPGYKAKKKREIQPQRKCGLQTGNIESRSYKYQCAITLCKRLAPGKTLTLLQLRGSVLQILLWLSVLRVNFPNEERTTKFSTCIHSCTYLASEPLTFLRLQELTVHHVSSDHHGIHSFTVKWRRRNHERYGAQRKTTGDWSKATVDTSLICERGQEDTLLSRTIMRWFLFLVIFLLSFFLSSLFFMWNFPDFKSKLDDRWTNNQKWHISFS